MTQVLTHTVTGATGYTGRYIATKLLEQGHRVQSITGHPDRTSTFGDRVPLHPFDFDKPEELEKTLQGTDTLFNTYWIRVNHAGRTHEECVRQTRTMFKAAQRAGARRIVHISITNPDPSSELPYFRGKGQLEESLRDLEDVSHAILRPTVLYSTEDILLNNIAWTLRRFPLVLLPGTGKYGIQPVFVEDPGGTGSQRSMRPTNTNSTVDTVGPEVFTYREMLELLKSKMDARCLLLPAPGTGDPYAAGRILGKMLDDIVLTMDEIRGLQQDLLVSKSTEPAPCPTRLSEWLKENAEQLGKNYTSEVKRHYR